MILDSVLSPKDIKNLSIKELKLLCEELRTEIVRITEKNGGHLGANLGAIELIIASHYVFDAPLDKFVFDVGHQAYAHKLITGRRKIMENLRRENGASGFPDPIESKYDCFISGHASTSLSASMGIAISRDLKKENFNVITFLGDGSLSGGMIYEAMNNISNLKNFVVILNDNQMSISESVGSMKQYLASLLSSKKALYFRREIRRILSKLPKKISKFAENFMKHILYFLKGGTIFEELGFQYIGPIDGNDLQKVVDTLRNIKDCSYHKPVILHAVTKKGKGYKPAEEDLHKMHGVEISSKTRYTDVFEDKIVELAEKNEKIVCITAAMKSGCGLNKFAEKFPNRFFDVGIAEEHAVTFAAGLAKSGFIPFVAVYSTFLRRSFDQIYHDVFLQNLPVKFILDKSGFPGQDGKTHSGLYDMAMFSMFDGFSMFSPSNAKDFRKMLEFASVNNKPTSIRFPKEEIVEFYNFEKSEFKVSNVIKYGEKTLVLSVGTILKNVLKAIEISKTNPTVIDVLCVNPFEYEVFVKLSKDYHNILIIEESIFGGFSSILIEFLLKNKLYDVMSKILCVNAPKSPINHGSRDFQLQNAKMSPEHIADILKKTQKRT